MCPFGKRSNKTIDIAASIAVWSARSRWGSRFRSAFGRPTPHHRFRGNNPGVTGFSALDAGISLLDTAPAYGWGRSEEIVGQAIAGRRDQVVLATKCGLWTADERGSFFTEFDGRDMRRSLRPGTNSQCRAGGVGV